MTRLAVRAARPDDDAGIRALLRRQVMDGDIRLTFEREPDFHLATTVEGERHHAFVAQRPTGEIVGLATRAVRRAWIGGEPKLVGYLAQLRRVPELKGGRHLLRDGFRACAATRRDDELPVDLTSIVAGNDEARRLLERGLPGLPTYRRLCRYWTLTFETRGGGRREPSVEPGHDGLLPAIADCLRRNLRRHDFAPAWTTDDLRDAERTRDLSARDFLVAREGDRVCACVAVWDPRRFKQVVVRGYRDALGAFRPLVNLGLKLARRPRLPKPNQPLALGFLSHVAVDDDDPDLLLPLVGVARRLAAEKGLDYLSMGLARRHPLAEVVRRAAGARVLESLLYLVGRTEDVDHWLARTSGCPHVEVATL